jgi:hypothetical protein
MSTSIIGIIVSVTMTFVNTLFDPEKLFMKTVNKFENSMELLWDCCDNNVLPKDVPDFDKHLDPLDGRKIAQEDIERQIFGKGKRTGMGAVLDMAKNSIKKDYVETGDIPEENIDNHDDEDESNAS